MNEELTLHWSRQILGLFSFRKRLLAWDTYEAHMTEKVKVLRKDMKVESVLIPGGCTKYIQAPDVYWNKPFKGYIGEFYDEWLANGVHQYTEAGNMKSASRHIVVTSITEAWSRLDNEQINSFKGFALNLKDDMEVKTFTALKRISLVLLVHSYYRIKLTCYLTTTLTKINNYLKNEQEKALKNQTNSKVSVLQVLLVSFNLQNKAQNNLF